MSASRLKVALLSIGALSATASAAEILNTGTPDGGFLGYVGYDVYIEQSVGISFTPTQDYTLDDIGVWMMSNDFDNPGAQFHLSLQLDASGTGTPSIPSGVEIEGWDMATAAIGWSPILDVAISVLNPVLTGGLTYWIVAESSSPPFVDPVWVWGSDWTPYYSGFNNSANANGWADGCGYTEGSAPGTVINATPVPTPGTLCLMGAAGIGALRRRR